METSLTIHPLTPERWGDLEALFGRRGAYGGCWCMWWRLPGQVFDKSRGASNRAQFKEIVEAGVEPGLLAYADGRPVGWCAIAPREHFLPRYERSRYWKPLEGEGVWSLNCWYIAPGFRKQGIATALLRAALDFAAARGARIVEGHPLDAGDTARSDSGLYFGTLRMFLDAGFVEVARRHPERPIVRRYLSAAPEDQGEGEVSA